MSKSLLFFVFLFAGSWSLQAQSGHHFLIRGQIGYALTGSGDRSGYVSHLDLGWHFTPAFKAALGYTFAPFDNGVYAEKGNSVNANSVELNAFYHVLNTDLFKIELGAGGHYQIWDWKYRAEYNETIIVDDHHIEPGTSVTFNDNQLGFNASLGLLITPIDQFEFGVWLSHQNGNEGNNISSVRLGVGVRL